MSKQIVLTVILFLCMPFLELNVPSTRANLPIIVVPDDYPTIQEAINNAVGGDMISVKAGIY